MLIGTVECAVEGVGMSDEAQRPEAGRRPRARAAAATIYDVANLAGVNPSTVSRALGKPGRVSAATEAKIRAAAETLNFRMNRVAQALYTGRTRTLALVVADVTNPVVFGVVRGAEQTARAQDHTLVIAETLGSGETESETIEHLLPSVDGVLLLSSRLEPSAIRELSGRVPVVAIYRDVPGVDSIALDIDPAMTALVDHLANLGHTSIAYLSGPPAGPQNERRWNPLLETAEARGIAAVEIGPNAPTLEGGRDALRRVQASRATAVVAFNDLMAIGLMQAASERGMALPGDLSVAGFDDSFGSEIIVPSLTTVRVPLKRVGERAADVLLRLVQGEVTEPEPPLAVELIVRGSTGSPRAR